MVHSLEVDGSRINVYQFGSGPPCLLLHGYPQNHNCWRKIIPALGAKRTLYAPDWFGWGASERSLTLSLRYEDEYPRVGKILDLLGIQRSDLIGHDYGGLLGLAFAAYNRDRIRSLALINSRAHGKIGFWTRWLLNSMIALAQSQPGRALIPLLPLKGIHQLMFRQSVQAGAFSAAELDEYLAFLNTESGRDWFAHFYHHFRTNPRTELGNLAQSFRFPVALIWGEDDVYFPKSIGQDLAARIPQSEYTGIKGCGHFSVEERPAEVATALLEALARSESM